jgi:hypothetical protein
MKASKRQENETSLHPLMYGQIPTIELAPQISRYATATAFRVLPARRPERWVGLEQNSQ